MSEYCSVYRLDLGQSHFVHEGLPVPMNKNSAISSPAYAKLREQILRTISDFEMFQAGDKVLIAVSGGPDSVALLYLLHAAADDLDIELGIGHLNHGLRPAAEKESLFVQELADTLNLPCHQEKVAIDPANGSLEERARRMRYAFFHRVAKTHHYTKIALAHHAEDNAETVLMHLLRGSGTRGLSGIPPMGKNGIVRPLIHSRRADILFYLKESGLAYCVDASNTDLRFTRNKIRHRLLPMLEKEFNPNIIKALNQAAKLYREDDQWLDQQVAGWLPEVQSNPGPQGFELRADPLAMLPPSLQRRLIRNALRSWRGHIQGLTADHVETLLKMASSGRNSRRANLPLGILVKRSPSGLIFSHTSKPRSAWDQLPATPFAYAIASAEGIPPEIALLEAGCCFQFSIQRWHHHQGVPSCAAHTIVLDLDLLQFPLTIRNFLPGDRIRPFGLNGTQKIKQLFIDQKTPPRQRHRIPLLVSGDEVLWVAGLRRGAAAPLTPETARILRIEMRTRKSP